MEFSHSLTYPQLPPERLFRCLQVSPVQAHMRSDPVIPVYKSLKTLKIVPVPPVEVEPFLQLAITLRMIVSAQDMPDTILPAELLEPVSRTAIFVPLVGHRTRSHGL